MREVELKRYAGPFDTIPFRRYIQSPIGLVPKAGGKMRLIFHLSFKFKNGNESVNFHTPEEICTVRYNDLQHAVKNSMKLDKERTIPGMIFYSKTDLVSAFRVLPLKRSCYKWMILMAVDPKSGEKKYFLDKNLPFGSSISCALFQKFSESLRHITEWVTGKEQMITNYLDDFLFIGKTAEESNFLVRTFLSICEHIGVATAIEKTEFATPVLGFLGLTLNGTNRTLMVPDDKKYKTLNTLKSFIHRKKATVKELQQLAGHLNFLNRAIVPGRTFTRRMYSKFAHITDLSGNKPKNCKLKNYHHINLDEEFRNDCKIWQIFLETASSDCRLQRPYMDLNGPVTKYAETLNFYTDSSANKNLGMGMIFDREWSYAQWEIGYIEQYKPSIQYLELLALVTAAFLWSHKIGNTRVVVHCDNKSVVQMINDGVSRCKNCMHLLRLISLNTLRHGTRLFAIHVEGKLNNLSDSLSRLEFKRFFKHAPKNVKSFPEHLPEEIWPASKLWIK